MDVGCGSGQGTNLLAPYFTEVVGTDISPAQLELALANSRPANVSYRWGTCRDVQTVCSEELLFFFGFLPEPQPDSVQRRSCPSLPERWTLCRPWQRRTGSTASGSSRRRTGCWGLEAAWPSWATPWTWSWSTETSQTNWMASVKRSESLSKFWDPFEILILRCECIFNSSKWSRQLYLLHVH